MKHFPTEANGTRNRYNFQCTTSPYASFMWSMRVAQSALPQENDDSAMGDGLGREGGGGDSDREEGCYLESLGCYGSDPTGDLNFQGHQAG